MGMGVGIVHVRGQRVGNTKSLNVLSQRRQGTSPEQFKVLGPGSGRLCEACAQVTGGSARARGGARL